MSIEDQMVALLRGIGGWELVDEAGERVGEIDGFEMSTTGACACARFKVGRTSGTARVRAHGLPPVIVGVVIAGDVYTVPILALVQAVST